MLCKPYKPRTPHQKNARRAARHNLDLMPRHLHAIYIALVDAVLPLDHDTLACMQALYRGLCARRDNLLGPDVCFMEHGEGGLRQQFFRLNRLPGRLDVNMPFSNLHQVLQFVALTASCRRLPRDMSLMLYRLQAVDTFVLLSDLVISGRSLVADCHALRRLIKIIGGTPHPTIIAAVMACTESGAKTLSSHFTDVLTSMRIPMSLSVKHPDCPLGIVSTRAEETAAMVAWFRNDVVTQGDLVWRMEQAMWDQC